MTTMPENEKAGTSYSSGLHARAAHGDSNEKCKSASNVASSLPPMPPLPGPTDNESYRWFSRAEMRSYAKAYGRACAEAMKERCAQKLLTLRADEYGAPWQCAAAIRAMGDECS